MSEDLSTEFWTPEYAWGWRSYALSVHSPVTLQGSWREWPEAKLQADVIPTLNNGSGIYVAKDFNDRRFASYRDGRKYYAKVRIWGHYVEHQYGYRAEWCEIMELFESAVAARASRAKVIREALEARYKVEVVPDGHWKAGATGPQRTRKDARTGATGCPCRSCSAREDARSSEGTRSGMNRTIEDSVMDLIMRDLKGLGGL